MHGVTMKKKVFIFSYCCAGVQTNTVSNYNMNVGGVRWTRSPYSSPTRVAVLKLFHHANK